MKMLYGMLDQMAAAERQAKEVKLIADNAKETAILERKQKGITKW